MKRRTITLTLAVLLSLLGTVGVMAYVHGADARALAGQRAIMVLVAAQPIPAGTRAGLALRSGLLSTQRWPAGTVPANAVRVITPELSSLVIGAQVQQGELLLRPILVPASGATGGLRIPRGMTAVTIALCAPEAVAGYVIPGSLVALYGTSVKSGSLSGQPGCDLPHQQQDGAVTAPVLSRVLVLAVGTGPAFSQSGSASSGFPAGQSAAPSSQSSLLLTLAVSPADAARVISLGETGLPYLSLLSTSP